MIGLYQIMLKRNKPITPFAKLFSRTVPADFVSLFGWDAPQTIVFMLSYCQSNRYVKKVLRLFHNDDLQTLFDAYKAKNKPDRFNRPNRLNSEFITTLEKYTVQLLDQFNL
jgi:hypothetical protein